MELFPTFNTSKLLIAKDIVIAVIFQLQIGIFLEMDKWITLFFAEFCVVGGVGGSVLPRGWGLPLFFNG